MFDFTQNLVRLVPLIVATGMFAGLWANDQHIAPQIIVSLQDAAKVVETDHHSGFASVPSNLSADSMENLWQPVKSDSKPLLEILPRSSPAPSPPKVVTQICSIDTIHLTISQAALQQHIDLLPDDLPSGDYRIIDSFGGVGWLIVRPVGDAQETIVDDGVWTTTVDGENVRFIRATPQPDRVA